MFPRWEMRHAYGFHGYRDDGGGGDGGGGDGGGGGDSGGGDAGGGDSSDGGFGDGGWSGSSSSFGGASLSGLGGLGGFAGPGSQGYGGSGGYDTSGLATSFNQDALTNAANALSSLGIDPGQIAGYSSGNRSSGGFGMGNLLSLAGSFLTGGVPGLAVSGLAQLGNLYGPNMGIPGLGSFGQGLLGLTQGNVLGAALGLGKGIAANIGGWSESPGTSLSSSIGGQFGAGGGSGATGQQGGQSAYSGQTQAPRSAFSQAYMPIKSNYNTPNLDNLMQLYALSQQLGRQG